MKNERNIALDVTRIIAVLSVVMIHTSAGLVTSYEIGSPEFMWGNILDSVSRIGVPLFIMISGSLMLDENRNVSIKGLLSHNIPNIVVLLFFWSGFYSIYFNVVAPTMRGETVNFRNALFSFIDGYYHLWYLFMIIGLYFITPFLREFVRKENKRLVVFFILIALATQFTIPLLEEIASVWNPASYIVKYIYKFYLGFFGGYTAYYIIGWYIVHIGIHKKHMFYVMGILSLLISITYVQLTKDYANGYSNFSLLILIYASAVFIMLNNLSAIKIGERAKKIITLLSKLTFGVYIIHPFFLALVGQRLAYRGNPLVY